MTTNPHFNQYSTATEQNLLESLIIESVQQYGFDIYYMPRVALDYDKLYSEYSKSAFVAAIPVEMYVKNVMGFEGQGDFVSQFGLEMRDTITFTVANSRFNTEVRDNALWASTYNVANVAVGGNTSLLTDQTIAISRPREGDLVYLPFANSFFEIKYTEDEQVFYPLGKLQTYDIRTEKFEYGGEYFATGNTALDTMMNSLTMATTAANNSANIEGNDPFAINMDIETEADVIIDFTDMDPFASGQY